MAEPRFPLQAIPTCLDCRQPCTRFITQSTTRYGRPAYACLNHARRMFSTFDDNVGITAGNPNCACQLRSRRETNNTSGVEFYRCPVGACRWTMNVPVTVPPAVPAMVNFNHGNGNRRHEEDRGGCCRCVVM